MALDFTGLIDQRQREIDRRGVEPVGYGNLSGDDLVEIDISQIKMNRLNRRTMREDDIQLIAESILSKGLITPLTVYRKTGTKSDDNPDGKDEFVIISGHRRFQAINLLNNTPEYKWHADRVLCHIIDAPSNNTDELELLAQANIHRYDNEDLKNEIIGCMDAWREMDWNSKKKLRKMYEDRFHEKSKNVPAYEMDSLTYTKQNFRPIYDYVRSLTGLDCSNSTIRRMVDPIVKAANLNESSVDNNDDVSVEEDLGNETEITADEARVTDLRKLAKKIEGVEKALKKFLDNEDPSAVIFNDSLVNQRVEGMSIPSYCNATVIPSIDGLLKALQQVCVTAEFSMKNSENMS